MKMVCLMGMPGCGKTTYAKSFIKRHPDYLYFSPDEYYRRINGDDCNRTNTFDVWMAMFCDINKAMKSHKNVLIDSDNLTYHQRMQWVEWFPDYNTILVVFDEPFNICLARVSSRRRKIPASIMRSKWMKKEMPDEKDRKYWRITRRKK